MEGLARLLRQQQQANQMAQLGISSPVMYPQQLNQPTQQGTTGIGISNPLSFPLAGGQMNIDVDMDILKGLKGFNGATANWERKF